MLLLLEIFQGKPERRVTDASGKAHHAKLLDRAGLYDKPDLTSFSLVVPLLRRDLDKSYTIIDVLASCPVSLHSHLSQ